MEVKHTKLHTLSVALQSESMELNSQFVGTRLNLQSVDAGNALRSSKQKLIHQKVIRHIFTLVC